MRLRLNLQQKILLLVAGSMSLILLASSTAWQHAFKLNLRIDSLRSSAHWCLRNRQASQKCVGAEPAKRAAE